MSRRLLLAAVLLALFVTSPALGQNKAKYKTQNVIVAVMDGVRYSETFGEPNRAYIPNLAALEKEGTLFTDFRITGPGISVTRQGHSTISSGTWQTVGLAGARLTRPTFFEYARNELGWKQTDCWCVFGKGKYAYADFSSFPGYGADFRPWFVNSIGETKMENDDAVLKTVCDAMDKDKPHLLFINFGYTDHIAHVSTFEEHIAAIKHCDEMLGKLWKKVQSTPGYKDATTVFFTNDHGRHDNKPDQPHGGDQSHGDKCEGCRHIMLLAVGPDVKRGAKIDKAHEEIDICPTVGELLGFQTPFADGQVLSDCLTDPLGLNTKAAKTAQAKAGVELLALGKRDLIKTVSEANLGRSIDALKPSVETEILMRGMLEAAAATKNDACTKYVEKWVVKNTAEAATDARVARVMLELGQAQTTAPVAADLAKIRACAEKLVKDGCGTEEPAKSMAIAFLARAGQVLGDQKLKDAAVAALALEAKTEQELVAAWRPMNVPNTPMACDLVPPFPKGPTMSDALRFRALADVAAAMPRNRVVRLACSLLGCTVSQGRPELGADWQDQAMSAVILSALVDANQVKPQIDWSKSEPAITQMNGGRAPAAAATPAPKKAKKSMVPRWAQPMKVFYFDSVPWQVLRIEYQIDANGHFAAGDAMSDGAALMMLCAVRDQNLGEKQIKSFSN